MDKKTEDDDNKKSHATTGIWIVLVSGKFCDPDPYASKQNFSDRFLAWFATQAEAEAHKKKLGGDSLGGEDNSWQYEIEIEYVGPAVFRDFDPVDPGFLY